MSHFTIDVRDFDANQLPKGSQTPGTGEFQSAVINWFIARLLKIGVNAVVAVDDEKIEVRWDSDDQGFEAESYAIELLQSGNLREGADVLQALAALSPDDVGISYNLGMALSDLGELGEAAKFLERTVAHRPEFANAWVALGVAQQRMGDSSGAAISFGKAVEIEPDNGYAHRNLGAILMHLSKFKEAGEHFRMAYENLPEDPQAAYGLASWIIDYDENSISEADELLKGVIASTPSRNPVVEYAKEARSKIAMKNLREIGGDIRMDAVMYLVGAIRDFKELPRTKVQEIGFEVAMLGRTGLDVNDPEQKYALRTKPGRFSGLHLMALMYAAFKVIEPTMDIGFDLAREYDAAKAMLNEGLK